VSLNRFRKKLKTLFLSLCLEPELELRYPSSSILRFVCLVVEYPDVAVKVVVEGVEEEEVEGAGVCRGRERNRVGGCG
jgi:hypothetical protein